MALVLGCVGCVGFECSRLNAQDWFNPWQQDLNSVSATTMKVSQVVVQPDGHSISQLSIAVYGCHQQGSKRAFQHSKADIEGVLTHALIKLVNFQGKFLGKMQLDSEGTWLPPRPFLAEVLTLLPEILQRGWKNWSTADMTTIQRLRSPKRKDMAPPNLAQLPTWVHMCCYSYTEPLSLQKAKQ